MCTGTKKAKLEWFVKTTQIFFLWAKMKEPSKIGKWLTMKKTSRNL